VMISRSRARVKWGTSTPAIRGSDVSTLRIPDLDKELRADQIFD
jgi:hypothetical protein